MLLVLSGPSAVGKSFSVEYLCARFDFKTLPPYTTRKPRISESAGFHYHFRSLAVLKELTANFSLGYWDRPLDDGNVYGYTPQVDTLVEDTRNWVIQASATIALAIKAKSATAVLCFLDFDDDDALKERINDRYADEGAEVVGRRLKHAANQRGLKEKFDHVISSNSPEQMVQKLLDIVFDGSPVLPQRLLSFPGPLADVDLRSSLESSNGLRIDGVEKDALSKRINGWSVDLTLAPRFYRVVHRTRIFRRVFDLAHGNSTDMLKRFRECIVPQGQGIYLRPHEFILGSTIERLCLPSGMVCLISGRSSYARMGLSIELSQIMLQPGHDDVIPLQIKNNMHYPIIIYPEVSIVQAVFFNTITPSATPYNVQARAKYPRHADDVRSRYYLDPAYSQIRASLPVKAPFDWNHFLNILLLLATALTATSWIVTQFPDPGLASAGKYFGILFLGVTLLALLVRLVRLLKRDN